MLNYFRLNGANDGIMAIGWKEVDGKWYYLYGDGSMASNAEISGYRVDANGVWIDQ